MKSLKTITILVLLTGFFATAESYLTEKQQQIITKKLEQKVKKYKDKMVLENDSYSKFSIEYLVDIFKVGEKKGLSMDIAPSNAGMVYALISAKNEYDVLLNKYYAKLIKKLSKKDKNILKLTQINWIKYRDSELKLNLILANDKYSGGGTIQRLYVANRVLEITKSRLKEIYDYLDRIH